MFEQQSAIEVPKQSDLREHVCAECAEARAGLNSMVQTEHATVPERRKAELTAWLADNLPDCLPVNLAAEICLQIEQDEAAAGFPEFRVQALDPAELREEVIAAMGERQSRQRNIVTTGQIDDGVPTKVPAETGQESALLTAEGELQDDEKTLTDRRAVLLNDKESETEIDGLEKSKTAELKALQANFNQLRADGVSTATALRTVIAQADNPETQQHLNAILSKVALLQTALPDKPEVVNRLLNTAGLNLAAATVAGSFAGFMEAAETDEALSATDRNTLRQIIATGDRHLKTGTQVREAALATTIDPATGETIALHTAENKAEVAPGVFTYTATGAEVILEISEGGTQQKIDVTGLDGQSIGTVAEIMGLSAMAETNGASGFIKHVYGVDFDHFIDQGFDPITLNGLRQKLTHLLGAGHDGEIMQPTQQLALLQTQMRLVSPSGSLLAWENDPEGYRANVEKLGLNNTAVLEAFGEYTVLNHSSGTFTPEHLQAHLNAEFPRLVERPETGDNRLAK